MPQTVGEAGAWVLAIATAIATLWGAAKAVGGVVHWLERRLEPSTEFDRTPRLGLEFWQQGSQAPMFLQSRAAAVPEIVRVKLKRKPFEMRIPDVPEGTAVQLCAYTDASIFLLEQGIRIDDVPPFSGGTGIADYEHASGKLFVTNRAHNYLIGSRLRRGPESQRTAFFASTSLGPLSRQRHPLFITVLIDSNSDGIAQLGEYEFIQLDF